MGWCFAPPLRVHGEHRDTATIKRFDPRFWTVNFPRPMMASVVTSAPDALRVSLAFTGSNNLAGLIWETEDKWDHPLLAYVTARDFRQCRLRFRWRSGGVKPLDAVHGPTLTIEGRDASGQPRSWYIRLWNYAVGTAQDAAIDIDFARVAGGFLHPADADTVWAGDVDRILISLVPSDYDGTPSDYAGQTDAWVELSGISCDGSGSVLTIGDAVVPTHGLSIATAYDDSYHLTPARTMRMVEHLGYSGPLLHYVGMSHYPHLVKSGGAWLATVTGGAMCEPARAWHTGFAAEAKMRDWPLIWSLSYELFADYCPQGWMQRTQDGAAALTGWIPPSALLSPTNAEAMGYLALVARAFVGLSKAAGLAVDFQIGEPWWWVTSDRKICLYDAATTSALGAASVPIADMSATLSAPQLAMLDAAGALLATSTAALATAVRDEAGPSGASVHLLTYLPTVLDSAMPEARRANMPLGWAYPAYDALQIEDYDWASRGQAGLSAAARAAVAARLGYPPTKTHYLAGFVLNETERAQWSAIANAASVSRAAGDVATFIWALPQVARDGFTAFLTETGAEAVQPFDDVDFPIALGREAEVVAEFSTAIIIGQSGAEQRAPDWDNARMRYDAGPGIRSEDDIRLLTDFYRARRGPAIGFRFRDPIDFAVTNQVIGVGDGVRTDFALIKSYGAGSGAPLRRITRPVSATVLVRIADNLVSGWSLAAGGVVRFTSPPATGVTIKADFLFDVPVRFADDRLEISRATYLAGEMASVRLVEVKEA
ncbi:MAG: DUF2460 domain-containing protein [Sphingopyxis sp.]